MASSSFLKGSAYISAKKWLIWGVFFENSFRGLFHVTFCIALIVRIASLLFSEKHHLCCPPLLHIPVEKLLILGTVSEKRIFHLNSTKNHSAKCSDIHPGRDLKNECWGLFLPRLYIRFGTLNGNLNCKKMPSKAKSLRRHFGYCLWKYVYVSSTVQES